MPVAENKKTVIIICGPTAVGKTAVAIEVAKHFGTEIISADSRQCFREMKIGVARPSEPELKAVPHYFIATHRIGEEVSASVFENYALQTLRGIFLRKDIAVMTGGTGLYIKAFCEGLDEIPPVPAVTRENIIAGYNRKGLAWLQKEVQKRDPLFFEKGEIQNPHRLIRALEVMEATGKSIMDFRKGKKQKRDFHIIKIGLELPREELNRQINTRVDQMMEQGLLEEVKSLLPFKHLPALQTVGYAELVDCPGDEISLAAAVADIKKHTRQYAKRQMTWFRKDKNIQWFHPAQTTAIITWLSKKLSGI